MLNIRIPAHYTKWVDYSKGAKICDPKRARKCL